MTTRPKRDRNFPFNKFLKKHPELALEDLCRMTGLTYFTLYHLKEGRSPTLLTAVALQHFTNGEITCEDLLSSKISKQFKEMKIKVACTNA